MIRPYFPKSITNFVITFSLVIVKSKRKDHFIVCFVAIVIMTIIDIYCISIRKSSEPKPPQEFTEQSIRFSNKTCHCFSPSYLSFSPFKNSSVQCRRTYPFFFLCTFGSFFILPVVNFFLFVE